MSDLMEALSGGPSPRGWGEPFIGNGSGLTNRTIPTRVGRTLNYQQLTSTQEGI